MPDGDSINWRVKGRGSRTVLNLIRSGADDRLVADEVIRMFVKQINQGCWVTTIRDLVDKLDAAVRPMSSGSDFIDRAEIFTRFCGDIEEIVSPYWDDRLRFLCAASERAFRAMETMCIPSATRDLVEKEFLSQAVRALLDDRVFQPTRPKVAQENFRNASEQMSYENGLLSVVGEEAKRLQPFIFGQSSSRVRCPPRSVPRRMTTIERLGEVLQVFTAETT